MQSQVTIAIIAAVTSLLVAVLSALITSQNARKTAGESRRLTERQAQLDRQLAVVRSDLEREAKHEERAVSARAELDLHREPLLRAALDLAHRLDNIRNDAFFEAYLNGGQRRWDIARSSTLYRFARYWCVVEILYDNVALLRFERDEATQPVSGKLAELGTTFASDRYGETFMMWREEQRAVAELTHSDQPSGCIGFSTFIDRLDQFQPWFESFNAGLQPDTTLGRDRLRVLQRHLAQLVMHLDTLGTYREKCESLLAGAEETVSRL